MSRPLSTDITIYAIAKGAKFIGDDAGGADITVQDARSMKRLAEGTTTGSSGPNGSNGVMCVSLKRGQPLPGTALGSGTASFTAALALSSPTQILVTATGPNKYPTSANTVSMTSWVYPGEEMTGENGLALEIPGLICQIQSPLAQTISAGHVTVTAYVAMMCTCPISFKQDPAKQLCPVAASQQPWLPTDFQVFATVQQVSSGSVTNLWLSYNATTNVTGQFIAVWNVRTAGQYEITVCAQQLSTGNTGASAMVVTVEE